MVEHWDRESLEALEEMLIADQEAADAEYARFCASQGSAVVYVENYRRTPRQQGRCLRQGPEGPPAERHGR